MWTDDPEPRPCRLLADVWPPRLTVRVVLVAWLTFMGAISGSFTGLAIERLPRHQPIAFDRSRCVCGALIPMRRNVPVLSYLYLRGRAPCCGAAIPRWYLAIESAMAIAALLVSVALSSLHAPPIMVVTGALIGCGLVATAFAAWRRRIAATEPPDQPAQLEMSREIGIEPVSGEQKGAV